MLVLKRFQESITNPSSTEETPRNKIPQSVDQNLKNSKVRLLKSKMEHEAAKYMVMTGGAIK